MHIDYKKLIQQQGLTTDETARALAQMIREPLIKVMEEIIEQRCYLVILKILNEFQGTPFNPIPNPHNPADIFNG